MIEVEVAGEAFIAACDRTLWWPERKTLFVADVHFGKASSFRNLGGIPVPGGTTEATAERLSAALERTSAERLIVLGDLWHSRAGRDRPTLDAVQAWREEWPSVTMALVEGNHDRRSGKLPASLGIEEWPEPTDLGPLTLRHEPEAAGKYVLSGHIHPGVRLTGAGQDLRLPCFWFGPEVAVLPAFGDFTGCAIVEPSSRDRVFVCAGDRLVSVGA